MGGICFENITLVLLGAWREGCGVRVRAETSQGAMSKLGWLSPTCVRTLPRSTSTNM